MECMIEIENLSLTMKKQIILSDINLTFEKGKIHGLIGMDWIIGDFLFGQRKRTSLILNILTV